MIAHVLFIATKSFMRQKESKSSLKYYVQVTFSYSDKKHEQSYCYFLYSTACAHSSTLILFLTFSFRIASWSYFTHTHSLSLSHTHTLTHTVDRMYVNGPEDRVSIPGRVKPKTQQKVLGTFLEVPVV